MTADPSIVLITGTTSGIGRALLKYYRETGVRLITVNRRNVSDELHEGVDSFVIDITNQREVCSLLDQLSEISAVPDLFVLNAGINKIDNSAGLNYQVFRNVMDTNLMGVMTFVGEIQGRKLRGRTVLAFSSTSNIIANPGHVGYHLSKRDLHRAFRIFAQSDSVNRYKTVILGPVHTNIMASSPPLEGFNKQIFNILAVSAQPAAEAIAKFIGSTKMTLRYPSYSVLFYYFACIFLMFFPRFYRGTRISSDN